MALKVASRGNASPFIVMEVMRAADEREAAGEAVYHLEVGQPGTSAPKAVISAAQSALAEHQLGVYISAWHRLSAPRHCPTLPRILRHRC